MGKVLIGIVSSAKTSKTITVLVQGHKTHPIYKKKYLVSKRYMAHDPKSEAQVGDKVSIIESRPLSARKRHQLLKIIERPLIREDQSVEAITAEPEEAADATPKLKEEKPKEAKK